MPFASFPSVFILAFAVDVWYAYNSLFMLPAFLYTSNLVWQVFLLINSVCSVNDKWKAIILLFVTGDNFFRNSLRNPYFLALSTPFICLMTYRSLLFDSVKDNTQYFTGFFVVAVVSIALVLGRSLGFELKLISQVALGFFAAKVGHQIITTRVQ